MPHVIHLSSKRDDGRNQKRAPVRSTLAVDFAVYLLPSNASALREGLRDNTKRQPYNWQQATQADRLVCIR